MKIRPDQLSRELERKIFPVYMLTGDEPLLLQESADQIRRACQQQGFTERRIFHVDRQFDWAQLQDEAESMSLFSEKKLIELRLGKSKPGSAGAKALTRYLESPNEDNVLLIESARLDANTLKSKWVSTIEKAGGLLQIWPISLKEMPDWLSRRATAMNLTLEREAVMLLSDRLEGNLLAAAQELEKLKLNYPSETISEAMVLETVDDSARYDVFNLTDSCLLADPRKSIQILSHLRAEGVESTFVLWALTKEVRLLDAIRHGLSNGANMAAIFKQNRVINRRQNLVTQTARRLDHQHIRTILALGAECDARIKGMLKGGSPWDTLSDMVLMLCGTRAINDTDQHAAS